MAQLQTPEQEAAARLHEASQARKCWSCGCFHDAVAAGAEGLANGLHAPELNEALTAARQRLQPLACDCLGCNVCFGAEAMNALAELGVAVAPACGCEAAPRQGWPPLAGEYTVLRYHAPIAICTLTDKDLAARLVSSPLPEVAVVGTLQTENLGVERLLQNVAANPNIRFVLLCGADSRGLVGHLPGQSLLALARNGIDQGHRVIGARGRRPELLNISSEHVAYFRRTVQIVDHIGSEDAGEIARVAAALALHDPGPATGLALAPAVPVLAGDIPERMTPDPGGYFVVFPDRRKHVLLLEHYTVGGVLDAVIQGTRSAALSATAIDMGLLTRLDHAAYLGGELARAEAALQNGTPYVQDAAPESAGVEDAPCCSPAEAHPT